MSEEELQALVKSIDAEFSAPKLKKTLKLLFLIRKKFQDRTNDLTEKKNKNEADERERKELADDLLLVQETISQALGQYSAILTESLDAESKRLNKLTVILIVLTAILSASTIIDILLKVL